MDVSLKKKVLLLSWPKMLDGPHSGSTGSALLRCFLRLGNKCMNIFLPWLKWLVIFRFFPWKSYWMSGIQKEICFISFSSWKGDPSFHTVSLPCYDFRQLNRLIYIGTYSSTYNAKNEIRGYRDKRYQSRWFFLYPSQHS